MNTSLTKRLLTVSLNFTWCCALAIVLSGASPMFAGPAPYEKNVAPAPLAPCDWSGFYIGLNFGVGEYAVNVTDNEYFYSFDTAHVTDINVLGGGTVGFNFQKGAAVFGIEADGAWANFSAHNTADSNVLGDYFKRGGEMDFFGTVRGRLGLAYENVLAYVTAGVAFADGNRSTNYNEDQTNSSNEEFNNWNANDFRVGLVGGVGVEYMMNCHWTVKAETLFAKFDKDTADSEGTSNGDGYTYSFQDEVWMVRLGVNYKFGGGH